jgi:hypothetical protein
VTGPRPGPGLLELVDVTITVSEYSGWYIRLDKLERISSPRFKLSEAGAF